MASLFDELHPLAEKVDEARTAVVDAAREWCREGKAGDEEKLKGAVRELDEAQMALGLKTAQVLLAQPKENPRAELPTGLAVEAPPPHPSTVGSVWTKKKRE